MIPPIQRMSASGTVASRVPSLPPPLASGFAGPGAPWHPGGDETPFVTTAAPDGAQVKGIRPLTVCPSAETSW